MSVLYEPKGKAREYAPLAVNLYHGCSHGCTYCYVPTIPPWKFSATPRTDFHKAVTPRKDVLKILQKDVKSKPGNGQRVMLCFTTDPYQPANYEYGLTREAIKILHGGGYNVQVLTKGGKRALSDIDCFGKGDAFATTMTLLTERDSRKWEPLAALPDERIAAAGRFYSAGIPTWISLEPVINAAVALEIINITHGFTDLFKIGKMNHQSSNVNWAKFAKDAVDLCEQLCQPYYIKRDLRVFLPEGYLGKHHVSVAEIEASTHKPKQHAKMQPALF